MTAHGTKAMIGRRRLLAAALQRLKRDHAPFAGACQSRPRRCGDVGLLDQRIPLAASRAFPRPARRDSAAALADE